MKGSMDAVVLCGGQGKRLRSVVADKQKVLAEIGGTPFLDILLKNLKRQGIQHVVLCTGYKAEALEEYYRRNPQGLVIEFAREANPLGTGGALKNARYFISSDPFLALNGDSFCGVDVNALASFHRSKSARASVVVSSVKEAGDFGRIVLDESGRITGFREKADTAPGYVNAGVYCFNEDVFSLMPEEAAFSLEYDFFPLLAGKGFYGFPVEETFFDIGTPQRYDRAKKFLQKGGPQ